MFRDLELWNIPCKITRCATQGGTIMESVPASSDVRELCKAVSQEEDSEQMMVLVDELLRVLDERQQGVTFSA